jgi:hypothetical protein
MMNHRQRNEPYVRDTSTSTLLPRPGHVIFHADLSVNYVLRTSVVTYMVADLVHFARCVVDSDNTTYMVIAFSSCLFVASETRQTARCHAARCRDVALSLGPVATLSI